MSERCGQVSESCAMRKGHCIPLLGFIEDTNKRGGSRGKALKSNRRACHGGRLVAHALHHPAATLLTRLLPHQSAQGRLNRTPIFLLPRCEIERSTQPRDVRFTEDWRA